jgi:uncharacterized membrane protein
MIEAGILIALWIAFAGTHMGMASIRLRPALTGTLGAQGYLGAYSLVAFATFVPIVWYYFAHKHQGPLLWAIPLGPIARWLLYGAMGAAFVLMASAMVKPSPQALGGDPSQPPTAMQRFTRHGLFMGITLFGLLHLIPNGYATDVAFFGGLAVFGVLGSWHQDQRKLALENETYPPFYAQTAFVPFTGREPLRALRGLPLLGVALGIVLAILLRYFHLQLF